jgi:hypothetical protein
MIVPRGRERERERERTKKQNDFMHAIEKRIVLFFACAALLKK